MDENIPACPLCGHANSSAFDIRSFREHTVRNRICRHCGLVYQSPRMPEEELERFYEREYRLVYQGEEGPTGKDLRVQRGRAAHTLDFISARIERLDRHLDIGSSAGVLLQKTQSHFHCGVTGVEPGESYRRFAEKQGIRVHRSLEALAEGGEGPFDLVSMMHVLEHLPDPVGYLVALREDHIRRDGRLLVEVPNLYGHDSFEVAHMTAFSPHTLRQVLEQAGYGIVDLKIHGAPRSKILPLYIIVLAAPLPQPDSKPVQPERLVPLKRRLAMLRRRLLERVLPEAAWLPIEDQ